MAYHATSAHANQISENSLLKRITDIDRTDQQNIHNIHHKSTQKLIVTKDPWYKPIVSEQKLEVQNIIIIIKPSSTEVYSKSNQNWSQHDTNT